VLGIREDDVVFSAAKLFFAYGLGNAMTFPLSVAQRRS
jgi:benzoate-CoA ligase